MRTKIFKKSLQYSLLALGVLTGLMSYGQQDVQFTQYMYNTMSLNPGYAGSLGHFTLTGLGRTQWVGLDGAPDTQTVSFHSPVGYSGVGIGLNIINDKIGPLQETYFDGNVSYTVQTSDRGNLSLGLRAGIRLFDIDWSRGSFAEEDLLFRDNVNELFPTLGAGLYYYTDKFYAGLSVPNFITTDHYDADIESTAGERLHYYLILGYVFDINDNIKFKPAFLGKAVSGAPLIADVSANFLFSDKLTLGLAWRWDDSVSALAGFQVTNGLNIGYAYDLTTTGLGDYNSGTHEIMLRFEVLREARLKSPRFF